MDTFHNITLEAIPEAPPKLSGPEVLELLADDIRKVIEQSRVVIDDVVQPPNPTLIQVSVETSLAQHGWKPKTAVSVEIGEDGSLHFRGESET